MRDFKEYVGKVKHGIKTLKDEASSRGYDKHLERVSDATKEITDVTIQKASSAQKSITETLDTATGQKIYEMLQENLELQEKYNNVLATKLSEALERIETLEHRVQELNK